MFDEACDVFNKDGLFKIHEDLKDEFENLKKVEERKQPQEQLETNMNDLEQEKLFKNKFNMTHDYQMFN